MITLIALLLDPVSLVLAIIGTALAKRPWHLLVVVFLVAFIAESIVAATGYGSWGRFFILRLIASAVHTAIGYAAFRALRRRRRQKMSEKYLRK